MPHAARPLPTCAVHVGFAPDDLHPFGHRSRTMQMGYGPENLVHKPVIAIVNTWSDAQPCHLHFKERVHDVKRGMLLVQGCMLFSTQESRWICRPG